MELSFCSLKTFVREKKILSSDFKQKETFANKFVVYQLENQKNHFRE